MLQTIEQAKVGDVVPVYKVVESVDALEYFAKLSDYGRSKNTTLFEFDGRVIGSADPCLKLSGNKENFEIIALNNLGRKFLIFLKGDFKFCDKVQYGQNKITGSIKKTKENVSEDQKLRLKGHMDIIRQVAFKFKPTSRPFAPYCGLFGAFSYDFIEHFEELAEKESPEPYYEFYFLDNLFVADKEKAYFISNALIMDEKKEKIYQECLGKIEGYENALKKKLPKIKKCKAKEHVVSSQTEKAEFEGIIQNIKKNISEGSLYRAFPSRTITSNYNAEPFDIYKQLREIKQSHYKFYVNIDGGILLGSSPELSLKASGEEEKNIEVKLIAGKNPRFDDIDMENKYEAELKINFKEIAKHIMAVDMERSNVAMVSKLGSRHLDQIFVTEKSSDEQHLVSSVKGILKEDLDVLHAYIAGMGGVGCPKIEAIKLLRHLENKRGYFSGSVCYINPYGDFEGVAVKNAIRINDKKAHISAEADVVYDSPSEKAFEDTQKKIEICLEAIRSAGGLK